MNLGNIIVQGGLLQRAGQDYDEEQSARGYAQRVRQHGIKAIEEKERLMPGQTDLELLKQEIQRNELAFTKRVQPDLQAITSSDISHKKSIQPKAQALDRGAQTLASEQQGLQIDQTRTARRLQPGQDTLAAEGQNVQSQALKSQQAANLWGLLKMGDKTGTLELLNNSKILFPNRKFSDIVRGTVPVRGNDGKSLVQNGQPVTEEVIQIVPADGGEPVFLPVQALERHYQKHGTRFEKAGNNIIRIDPQGNVTPAYEPDQFAVNPETGEVYNKRTGKPPAASGIAAPGGASGTPASGASGTPGGRKRETHVDARVRQGTAVINRYFGISDLSGLDPANQPAYARMVENMGRKVRAGKAPEAAAAEAVREHEREQELTKVVKPGSGTGSYTGPTPWKPITPGSR